MNNADNLYACFGGTIENQVLLKTTHGPRANLRKQWILEVSRTADTGRIRKTREIGIDCFDELVRGQRILLADIACNINNIVLGRGKAIDTAHALGLTLYFFRRDFT